MKNQFKDVPPVAKAPTQDVLALLVVDKSARLEKHKARAGAAERGMSEADIDLLIPALPAGKFGLRV